MNCYILQGDHPDISAPGFSRITRARLHRVRRPEGLGVIVRRVEIRQHSGVVHWPLAYFVGMGFQQPAETDAVMGRQDLVSKTTVED